MKNVWVGVIIATTLFGCAGGKSVDGKWNLSGGPNMPPGSKSTATFSGGKNLNFEISMDQDIPGGKKMNTKIAITGSYVIEKDTMTMTASDVKMTTSGAPDSMKSMIESAIKGQTEIIKDQINKQGPLTLTWVDDKSFNLKAKSGEQLSFSKS